MKPAAFLIAVTLGIAAALGATPARAGDVSVGFGFSVGSGGGFYGHSGRRWRRPHGHARHYRRHYRHDHGPYVVFSYGYPKDYDESVDYAGAPDYPDMTVDTTVSAKAAKETGYCREFLRDVVIDGETVQAHGRACRQEDGSWKIVNGD